MKKILIYLAIIFNSFSLTILLPKAPPSLPVVKSVEGLEEIELIYYTDATTEVLPNIIKDKDYLYIIPVNLGAKLYNKGKDLRLIGVLSEGLISLVSTESYETFEDLDKKEIYIGAQGSSPDVISRYLFDKSNIKPNINYRSSQEITKLLIGGKANTAVLPEPLASLALFKNKNLKRTFIYKDIWKEVTNYNSIPQVGIFGRKDLNDKEIEIINKFIENYKNSLVWIEENPSAASKLALEHFTLTMPEVVISQAIENMNLTFKDGTESKEDVKGYLQSLIDIDKGILSELPDEKFYIK